MDREAVASERFACSDRERCIFETGIKLGTIYHQYVGTPVNKHSVKSLEKSMEEAIGVQPYVVDVSITIDKSVFPEEKDRYSYVSLTGEMINSKVTVKINNVSVTAEMHYDEILKYPLMYVSSIKEE